MNKKLLLAFLLIAGFDVLIPAQTFYAINGPMGVVNKFAQDSKGNVYIASETKGVFISTNKGASWKTLGGNSIGVANIEALCFSENEELIAATLQGGIKLWSGNSWTSFNTGLPVTGGQLPAFKTIIKSNSGHYFAGAFNYTTQQGGAFYFNGTSWSSITEGLVDSNIYCMAISADDIVYAGTLGSGVYYYNGSSWISINSGLGDLNINCLKFSSDGNLYAGTKKGVYVLIPGTSIWNKKGSDLNTSVLSICFDESKLSRIFIGLGNLLYDRGSLYGDIMVSEDNGNNWDTSNFNSKSLRISDMIICEDGSILAGAQGIYKSVDKGLSWIKSSTGFDSKISNFLGNGLAINSKGDLFFGSHYGVFKSTDGGANWDIFNTGLTLPMISMLEIDSFDNVFVGALALRKGLNLSTARLFRSTDGGVNWDTVSISNDDSYSDMAIAPNGDYFCTHGFGSNPPSATIVGSSLAISKDKGASWQDLNLANAGKGFAVAINSKGYIYYGGELNGVYLSTDNGQNFTQNIDPAIVGNIAPLAISPQDDIFTCGYGIHHIYYSDASTAGMPFTNMTSNTFPSYVGASSFAFDDKGKLFIGTQGGNNSGLYTSTPPWSSDSEFTSVTSVGPVRVITMKWDKSGYLWLLSNGFLMKSDSVLKFDPLITNTNSPNEYDNLLFQNYPNPFESETTISFNLNQRGHVILSVYNTEGTKIKTIVNSYLNSGFHSYQLNATDLSKGAYFLELEHNGKRLLRKIIRN